MASKSIKTNYIYNLIYQVFLIVIPLVTTPYVSRILQSDGVGQNAFASSINTYFVLIASLGFTYYAQREIAKCDENKAKESNLFWEIMIVKFLSSILGLCLYSGLILLNVFPNYELLLWIYGINIVAVAFDTTFVFQGNEDFKSISIRNFIVKAAAVVCVFVFVKEKSDLWKYALINACGTFGSVLIMIPFLRKYLVRVSIRDLKPSKHIVPSLRLFLPNIAVSVYTILDKTMIGLLIPGETTVIENGVEVVKKVSEIEDGCYTQSENISKMLLTIITALGTVMIPRNSALFKVNDTKAVKENVYKAVKFVYFLGLPMMLGVIAVAKNFSPWFFGDGYDKVPALLMIFSGLIMAIGLNNVFGVQYLIPSGRDKMYTIHVLSGAVFNFCMNMALIPIWQSYGAAIASVAAEFLILILQIITLRKEFDWKRIITSSWKYLVAATCMFVPTLIVSFYLSSSVKNTFLLVAMGISIYMIVLIALKEDFIFNFFATIKRKFKKDKSEDSKGNH